MNKFEIKTAIPFPTKLIADLMAAAIEGGSVYWLTAFAPVVIDSRFKKPWYADPEFWESDFRVNAKATEDNRNWFLEPYVVQEGLVVMSQDYPTHFKDAIEGNFDAVTADVFLQCCMFGEVTYG